MKRTGIARGTTRLVATKGLERKAEFPRGGGLTRSAPMPRTPNPDRAPRPRTPQQAARAAQLDTWADIKHAGCQRDGWMCVGCGHAAPLDGHHRDLKGIGGSKLLDHIANCVSLCRSCHDWAHAHRNTDALDSGLCVPKGTNPATWPVRYSPAHGGGLWLLTDAGDRQRVGQDAL